MRKITKRSAAIIAASVLAVGGAGAAWAAWTSSGTADVSATAGTAAPLVVAPNPVVSGTLVPGSKASVQFTVTNNNSYPVKINSLSLGSFTSTDTDCNVGATFQQVPGAALPTALATALAANTSATYTWTDSLSLTADPDDNCQGAPIKFILTASGVSAAS
jgi:hypothetical protein